MTDAEALALFIRYENTYNRAFSTALKDLLRVRAEKRKAEIGFEAQKRQEQAEIRAPRGAPNEKRRPLLGGSKERCPSLPRTRP